MEHQRITFGSVRVLVCEPQTTTAGKAVGYGNLVRQVEQALRLSASLGLDLCLIRPRRPLNAALFDLQCDQVRILRRGSPLARGLAALWRLGAPWRHGAPGAWTRARLAAAARPRVHAAARWLRGHGRPRAARWLAERDADLRKAASAYDEVPAAAWRRLAAEARERARATGRKRHPPKPRLAPADEREARRLAARAGLDPDAPFVTLHVRESGYRGRPGFRQRPFDRLRDARIETYRPAVEALVARGLRVVRIGDASMTPCDWPGVVDAATAPWRTDHFELWAVLNSRFLIAADSGPYFLAQLARVPALAVNVIQVGYYTRRPEDRYLCKHVLDTSLGRELSVAEMLTPAFVGAALDEARYRWRDDTPEEIREAVEDMLELETGGARSVRARSAAQRRHDELVAALAAVTGPDRPRLGLLRITPGRGTISRRFADRCLAHAEP